MPAHLLDRTNREIKFGSCQGSGSRETGVWRCQRAFGFTPGESTGGSAAAGGGDHDNCPEEKETGVGTIYRIVRTQTSPSCRTGIALPFTRNVHACALRMRRVPLAPFCVVTFIASPLHSISTPSESELSANALAAPAARTACTGTPAAVRISENGARAIRSGRPSRSTKYALNDSRDGYGFILKSAG